MVPAQTTLFKGGSLQGPLDRFGSIDVRFSPKSGHHAASFDHGQAGGLANAKSEIFIKLLFRNPKHVGVGRQFSRCRFYGGFADDAMIQSGAISLFERPGIGFEGQARLYWIIRELAGLFRAFQHCRNLDRWFCAANAHVNL
jgi:hypothetical protein